MELLKRSLAGTVESSDALIEIIPWDKELEINLKSDVEKQYGKHIINLVKNILNEVQVNNVCINIIDKGALDFTISARLKTALYRASK